MKISQQLQRLFWMFYAAIALAPHGLAQVAYLDHEHMDFRLQYNPTATGTNQFDIILGYDSGTNHLTVTNHGVYIVGNTNAKLTIPANPNYAFLGPAGSPVWVLPQSQNTSLPYLGISSEDLPGGVFDGPVALELRSVSGPGNFFAWAVSGAGQPPTVKMIFTNGVVNANINRTSPLIGSHEHCNWGFSTNGLYCVTFRSVGRRLGEATNIIGKEVTWTFQILPLRPWEQWVSTNWPPATATNIIGQGADPDSDGIGNDMEYALGLNPNSFSTNGRPAFAFVTEGPNSYGALSFTRVKAATDLGYEPSARSQLSAGDWSTLTNVVNVIDNGDTETVTVRDFVPVSATPQRFYQLRARLFYP